MRLFLKRVRRNLAAVRDFFTHNALELFPWKVELATYRPSLFGKDLRASLNVSLLAIPQGLAYAAIAEIPIVYGIAASAIAAIVAPLLASSRHTILGPTNATAFMVYSFFIASPLLSRREELLPLLMLMVGVLCVVGALFKTADLLQYISRSVLVGYISGAAVLIMSGQFKHVLGIDASGRTFFSILHSISTQIDQASWEPLMIGSITLLLYLSLQKFLPSWPNFAIVLALMTAATYGLAQWSEYTGFAELPRFSGFALSDLQPAIPGLGSPSLFDDISALSGIAFALAFIAALENTVMAKQLASQTGDRPDVNQDMLSVGAANIACSLIAPMPASGSLTRSALNASSGAETRFAGLISGLICLGGLGLLIAFPLTTYVPRCVLAALVIGIALSLFKLKNIRICLRSTRSDMIVLIVTFFSALLAPLYVAIFIGTSLSILLFLQKASKPHLVEYGLDEGGSFHELKPNTRPNPEISIVHVEGDLFFGAAELFRSQVQRAMADPNLKVIILRLKNARNLDATSVMALGELITTTRAQGRFVLISGANRGVYRVLRNSGLLEVINTDCDRKQGESNIFPYTPSNPNIATRNALKRAQKLLGTRSADIRIFYDPTRKKNS